MMLAVLLTIMTGRVHDATPNRDTMHQPEDNDDREDEDMDAEQAGDGEGEDVSRRMQMLNEIGNGILNSSKIGQRNHSGRRNCPE